MYEPDPEHFDTGNRAYQRFLAIAEEHFTVAVCKRDRDERPVMMSLTDLASGDTFTIVLMDTVEDTEPHIVLAVDPEAMLTARGVLTGATAAADCYAGELPHVDLRTVANTAIALLAPDLAGVPDTAWKDLPADLADRLYPAERSAPAAVVVLRDRAQRRLCAVGPFTSDDQAADWPHPTGLPDGIAHLVVGLHERQVSA